MIGIILLGQSNSGKSTIGKVVAEKLSMRYISSGDIARNMNDTQIQEDLNSGKLAPEDKMRDSILREINSSNVSYILDGFPRFYDQYEWLNQHINYDLIYVYIHVPYWDIIDRAKSRGRDDDDSINKKIEFFNKYTEPMIYEIFDRERFYTIDNGNNKEIEDNINTLCKIVEENINANNSEI